MNDVMTRMAAMRMQTAALHTALRRMVEAPGPEAQAAAQEALSYSEPVGLRILHLARTLAQMSPNALGVELEQLIGGVDAEV